MSSKDERLVEALSYFGKNNADVALNKLLELIDDGLYEASSYVGLIYEHGANNVICNYEKAKFYYEQSIEQFGATDAYLGLIKIYYYGLGLERDYCKANEYCTILLEKDNNGYADFIIGKMYMEGHCFIKNYDKARIHFNKAWDKGYVFALTFLGFLEQKKGNKLRGIALRIKAGFAAYMIAIKNTNDPRIRELNL